MVAAVVLPFEAHPGKELSVMLFKDVTNAKWVGAGVDQPAGPSPAATVPCSSVAAAAHVSKGPGPEHP